jgi:hypothetical protein
MAKAKQQHIVLIWKWNKTIRAARAHGSAFAQCGFAVAEYRQAVHQDGRHGKS